MNVFAALTPVWSIPSTVIVKTELGVFPETKTV